MNTNEYKFFAFISYRHTDIRAAKRLQALLESYYLPTEIKKQVGAAAPKRFKVFRDTDELTAGVLGEELQRKLDESKYLVVICSPDSAQSKYVGDEISYFRSKGRERQIIPFIIDGVPHSERECFHPKLTEGGLELLGIDVQAERGFCQTLRFHKAFIRLVAKMLELDFGVLWNRRKHFLIKRTVLTLTILAVVVALGLSLLKSQPFDASLKLQPVPESLSLPLSGDDSDSLWVYLDDNDVHARVVQDLDSAFSFQKIPGKYEGKDVRLKANIYGFQPLDTVVTLQPEMQVRLRRDPETYGRVRLKAYDDASSMPLSGVEFDFGFMKATTDGDGLLDVLVPLDHQTTPYPVSISRNGRRLHIAGETEDKVLHYGNMTAPYSVYLR